MQAERCAPRREPAIRFFASSHQLHQLAPRTRILCTLFLLGILGQALSGIIMHHLGPGWAPSEIATYYRGDDAAPAIGGDRFGLGDDTDPSTPPRSMTVARTFGSLLEVAHLHLVAMPLVLFVVAHLFSMIDAGRGRWGGALCYGGFAGAALDISMPFAVRYGSAAFAPLKLAGFVLLEACLVVMVVLTLIAGIASFFSTPSGSGRFSRAD